MGTSRGALALALLLILWLCVLSQQARTPLEQEIFGLLHKTQQPITDPLLTLEEKASLQAMSLEEVRLPPAGPRPLGVSPLCPIPLPCSWCSPHAPGALPVLTPCSPSLPGAPWQARRRRAELQKARALQSYYEAKARRAKRIKSKK